MGKIVHQGLDEKTVLDDHFFIVVQGDAETLVVKMGSLAFELIPPDICFVDEGVLHRASAQQITPCQAGILEFEMQGEVRGKSVKCVELGEFFFRNDFKGIRAAIHFGTTQIDVDPVDDTSGKLSKMFHGFIGLQGLLSLWLNSVL
jgi:hypothetical protein